MKEKSKECFSFMLEALASLLRVFFIAFDTELSNELTYTILSFSSAHILIKLLTH